MMVVKHYMMFSYVFKDLIGPPISRSHVLVKHRELFDEHLRMSASFSRWTSHVPWEQDVDGSRGIGFKEVCTSIFQ